MPSGQKPVISNTYPIPDTADQWWFGAYSPNTHDAYYDPEGDYNSLYLYSYAGNGATDQYNTTAHYYDPVSHQGDLADNLPLPPQLFGKVDADNTDAMTAYYVWTGDPAHVPDHANFVLHTTIRASAYANYGNAGATSGVAAKAMASVSPDTVTAIAGDAGSNNADTFLRGTLIRAVPVGNLITLLRVGSVSTETSNGLPYATWEDSKAAPGTTGPGTNYYGGPGNGLTNATASASVAVNSLPDSRDLTLYRDGAKPGFIGNDGKQHGDWTDASGTTHGETTFSFFTDAPPRSNTDQNLSMNVQTLHPKFAGNWTLPPSAWAWDEYSEAPRQWNAANYAMLLGNIYYVNGVSGGTPDSPYTYDITYTATDVDSVSATANYILTVHDQWENLRLDPTHPFDVIDNDNPIEVNGVYVDTQENVDTTEPSPILPLTVGFSLTTTLTPQLNGSLKLGDFLTLGGSLTTSLAIAATTTQAIGGAPIPPLSYVQLYWHEHYHMNHWLVDHYTPPGFDASYSQIIAASGAVCDLHWGHPERLSDIGNH